MIERVKLTLGNHLIIESTDDNKFIVYCQLSTENIDSPMHTYFKYICNDIKEVSKVVKEQLQGDTTYD